jgi:hypothetical protein
MRRVKWFSSLIVALIFSITFGCTSSNPTGHLSVLLTDWPILDNEVTAVNIFVTEVEVRQVSEESDENDEAGWIEFPDINQEFNLLDLQNGITVSLGDAYIPVGTYTELRLHVSEENTIEFEDDAMKYPLNIPSGISSGVKIKHTFTISEGDLLTITLDFDAQQSVKAFGSSSDAEYQLHPVIRVKE